MPYRLTRIYTRTGDAGQTGLGDGSRVDKDDARIEAIGAVDELNSSLGVVLTHALPPPVREALAEAQHRLFDLGGELSLPGRCLLDDAPVRALEQRLDALNADLPPLENFILPAGPAGTAACHLARAICRRAERRLVGLARTAAVNPAALRYLNRLSDLLFVAARAITHAADGVEVVWRPYRAAD